MRLSQSPRIGADSTAAARAEHARHPNTMLSTCEEVGSRAGGLGWMEVKHYCCEEVRDARTEAGRHAVCARSKALLAARISGQSVATSPCMQYFHPEHVAPAHL